MPPAVGIISWVIFATEEIGHIIEEPFGRGISAVDADVELGANGMQRAVETTQLEVLPLGRYCADIASDVATIFNAEPMLLDEMPSALQILDRRFERSRKLDRQNKIS